MGPEKNQKKKLHSNSLVTYKTKLSSLILRKAIMIMHFKMFFQLFLVFLHRHVLILPIFVLYYKLYLKILELQ